MATIRGARALGMEKEIGSIEPAKRADLITVHLDRPHAMPLYDVYSQMVYALKGSDVRDVMVNGRVVVRDAEVLTLDAKQVITKAEEFGRKVRDSLSTGAAR
jgi:5-methylthioadenosine/S-adenosylhomocysteine deaminase